MAHIRMIILVLAIQSCSGARPLSSSLALPGASSRVPSAHADEAAHLSSKQISIICFIKQKLGPSYYGMKNPAHVRDSAHQSCAVVSSSGAMANHTHGQEIDNHDIVIRFNDAVTEGYQKQVGSRTTLRLGWHMGTFEDDASVFHGTAREVNATAAIQMLSHLYPTKLGMRAETDQATTGFYGMLWALFNCASIDAYEMAPSEMAWKYPYCYYHSGMSATSNSYHSYFKAEHDLWRELSMTSWDIMSTTGRTHSVGFMKVDCPDDFPQPGSLE